MTALDTEMGKVAMGKWGMGKEARGNKRQGAVADVEKREALMKLKFILLLNTMLCLLFYISTAYAGSAIDVIKNNTEKVISLLQQAPHKSEDNKELKRDEIKKIIAQNFDFEEMSQRTLSIHWKKITDTEKEEFIQLFTELLENIYITKIEKYTSGAVNVNYIGEKGDGSNATVETEVKTSSGIVLPLHYRLNNKDGNWKVYDVNIEGVSLVNNYRSQFSQILNSKDFSYLINTLKEKNKSFKDS
ncbi:Toluene tolerance [Candidatus Magnetoovum chiemensis]|nr:Toluene tolerance [Candidatus Magnetoovum chiemensis]